MKGMIIAAALLATFASAPLALTRRAPALPVQPPEIVSMPGPAAPARSPALSELDLKPAWRTFVGLRLIGAPCSREADARFIDAFFDGRLPAAADYVRASLASLDEQGAIRIADRARSLDRALVQLRPAPASLVRVFVERTEDPDAHVEATRAQADEIARLVADPVLGWRAFALLRAAESVSPEALKGLSGRLARDSWAREALSAQGMKAIPVLLEAIDSNDPVRRAAGAWVLAGLGDPAYAERILQAAVPELARDSIPGNAAFAIRALTALGDRARPAVRVLLKSADDQAVAAALQVLMRTGGASAEELEAARSRVERLASRAGEAGDETSIGLELRAALAVTAGAMLVPDPPERLNPSQANTAGRDR